MRLDGLLAVITGGSGGIGQVISKRFLEEGAEIIITGRSLKKLEQIKEQLGSEYNKKIHCVVIDASNLESLIKATLHIRKNFRKIDILVNNAGSAGPMETVDKIPLSRQEGTTGEVLQDALDSLLGFPWSVTCALLRQLQPGGAIINISTIFSKAKYYGRAAYTVPKASLNALSHLMAQELGQPPSRMRVNTVYPGPVESDRIRHVLAVMDELRGVEKGTCENEITSKMLLQKPDFLSKEDIANTIVFLASEESRGISDQNIEVTHGLQTPPNDTIEISLEPNPRIVSLDGHYTWIIGGSEIEDASAIAQKHYDKGAEILLTFRDADSTKQAAARFKDQLNFTVKLFDPINVDDWKIMGKLFNESLHYPNQVFILPHHSNKDYLEQYGDSVIRMPLEKIQDFLISEIADAMITAHFLSQTFQSNYQAMGTVPIMVFISNGPDKRGNKFDRIRSEGIKQLIRTWRLEEERSEFSSKLWQLIRYENEDVDNLNFTANLAISISAGITSAAHINIAIAKTTQRAPFEFTYNQKYHQMLGNLDGYVTLITGGSEGIGRETARILVQGGAHVMIASRTTEKLVKTKQFLVKELTANGFPEAETRITTVNLDVCDEESVKQAFEKVVETYGRVDFIINNAGITGMEQMIFDISIDGWRTTLQANLISNYDLMVRSIPYMKKQKHGTVINLSSSFGGQRYSTPSYPIRADYAVTKSGQRALAEYFSSVIGPEVKINTISPGPVEGDRVRGGSKRPGLYYRRAMINMENKRVTTIYDHLVEMWRESGDISGALEEISTNEIAEIRKIDKFSNLVASLEKDLPDEECGYATHILTKPMVEKLLNRLKLGKYLPEDYQFKKFNEPPAEFLPGETLTKKSASIANRAVKMLALGHMPSEYDVGREIVFNLSSKSVTGEALYPTGGLSFPLLAISGDFTAEFFPSLYDDMLIKTVMIVGDGMSEERAEAVRAFAQAKSVKKIIVVGNLPGIDDPKVIFVEAKAEFDTEEKPDIILSFPNGALPETEELPDVETFKKVVEEHVTNHFQVARRAALIDGCRVFFVTQPLPIKSSNVALSFGKFVAATLAPLTVTAGQECSRITHKATFYQINGNPYKEREAYQKKLMDALLLLSLPLKRKMTMGRILNLP